MATTTSRPIPDDLPRTPRDLLPIVIAPVIAYRIVAGTPLDFFFKRPDMFRLTAPRGVKRKMVAAAGGH